MAPVDHVLLDADEEVSTTEFPAQMFVGPPAEMVGVGTVEPIETTVGMEVNEGQPPTVVVTVYDPAVLTVIDGVVAPFDQRLPVADDEVKTTEPPEQNVVDPLAVIVGTVGNAFTVIPIGDDIAEQKPLLTVTEYDPEVETVMD